jgi:putative membrane protein
MRLIRWLVMLPFAALVISFAVSNLDSVTVRLEPFPFTLESPLYLLVLLAAMGSFFVGALAMWPSAMGARRRARRAAEQAARAEALAADLKRQLIEAEARANAAMRPPAGPGAMIDHTPAADGEPPARG